MQHLIELNWIIKAENLDLQSGEYVKTDDIDTTIPNLSFQIRFFPNGLELHPNAKVVLWSKTDSPIEIKFTVTTPSANTQFLFDSQKLFTEKENNYLRYAAMITLPINLKTLDEVTKTSQLTLQFRGTLKKEIIPKLPFQSNPLREILWNKPNKDFTLIIDSKELRVDKFLIAARSPYFCAMLNSPWNENEEGQSIVEGFSFEVVEKAIKFMYDFPLTFASNEEALAFFNFGEYYDIRDLRNEAENYLISQINSNSVGELANISMKYNAKNLRLLCLNFLLKCQKSSSPIVGIESLDPEFNNELTKNMFCIYQNS